MIIQVWKWSLNIEFSIMINVNSCQCLTCDPIMKGICFSKLVRNNFEKTGKGLTNIENEINKL